MATRVQNGLYIAAWNSAKGGQVWQRLGANVYLPAILDN